ncbi:MAG: transcription termination/antitermination protein NusA [Spirochaetales bacterium]|nr:transcription termination/antitermination protein NusA [Spirochaetales bacterium]
MASGLADAIRQLVHEKGISEELVVKTIEDFLLAAYKRKFGTSENAVVRFNDDETEVSLFARKKIVQEVEDPVLEIGLQTALTYNEDCEIGDELLIEIDPKDFDRMAIQSAKQKARQTLREIQKDTLYSEFHEKVGEMIIGYYQRERNGNIYVDLGKTEGVLPKRFQSPREVYRPNDRIKSMIYEVNKTPSGLQIVLTRTHTEFVKRIFELEVPEVYDRTVEIFKIVREPGYRTKLAVYSNREDVDPVGACVGMKGVRIQAIVRELEGEKIDILKYDTDPKTFIKNALSPAEVKLIILLDEGKRQALAVVEESQLSLAIGKQGLNVRLANRLVDWNIDVKTEDQFNEMDISLETKKAVSALFGDVEEEEIEFISELPGMPEHLVSRLAANNIQLIETLINMSTEELLALENMTDEDVKTIESIIAENVDIIEEEEEDEGPLEDTTVPSDEEDEEADVDEGEEAYECPECGSPITIDMTVCPNCGVGLSFEVEEDSEDEDA